jgi:hypothetical protein
MSNSWFEIDNAGLAKLVDDRGKVFILQELLQNCWDEDGVTKVDVTLGPVPGRPVATLTVADDSPEGFKNLSHAWTMFAESNKKCQANKRGRFNMGEKVVLALCNFAKITSTTGTVTFFRDGTRRTSRDYQPRGTSFIAEIPMTRDELVEIESEVARFLPPPPIDTTFNGRLLTAPPPVTAFEAVLPTVVADAEGVLRRVTRKTIVEVYQPAAGEKAMIFEMGIPVVETGDTFHVNIQQKVPLNMDRDNVGPAYLRALRVEVLNHTAHLMDKERAASTEVQEATSDPRIAPSVVNQMLTHRFGDKRFTFDPSDHEANNRLVSEGFTPIMGGSLNASQWENVRAFGLSKPAGEISPTPSPYNLNGRLEKLVPPSDWTPGMRWMVEWLKKYALGLGIGPIDVKIANEPTVFWLANYGPSVLTLNLGRLGHKWFESFPGNLPRVIDLAIHEFGHHYEMDHLSSKYHDALTELGARSTILALQDQDLFFQGPPPKELKDA